MGLYKTFTPKAGDMRYVFVHNQHVYCSNRYLILKAPLVLLGEQISLPNGVYTQDFKLRIDMSEGSEAIKSLREGKAGSIAKSYMGIVNASAEFDYTKRPTIQVLNERLRDFVDRFESCLDIITFSYDFDKIILSFEAGKNSRNVETGLDVGLASATRVIANASKFKSFKVYLKYLKNILEFCGTESMVSIIVQEDSVLIRNSKNQNEFLVNTNFDNKFQTKIKKPTSSGKEKKKQ